MSVCVAVMPCVAGCSVPWSILPTDGAWRDSLSGSKKELDVSSPRCGLARPLLDISGLTPPSKERDGCPAADDCVGDLRGDEDECEFRERPAARPDCLPSVEADENVAFSMWPPERSTTGSRSKLQLCEVSKAFALDPDVDIPDDW